jgi:hypothetical protein
MICPRCDATMHRRKNPFFGVGLAVHEYIESCPECDYYEFISTPSTAEPETGASPPKRSALRKLNRRRR